MNSAHSQLSSYDGRDCRSWWWEAGGQRWLVLPDQFVWHYGAVPSYPWELWERKQEELVQINQFVKPDLVGWFEV